MRDLRAISRWLSVFPLLGLALAAGCKASATGSASASAGTTTQGTGPLDATATSPDAGAGEAPDSTEGGPGAGPGGEDTSSPFECEFTESFDGLPDGAPWPAVWVATGGVAVADVQGGRGRLRPIVSGYSLARVFVPMNCRDVDVQFTFMITDNQSQGAGLYVRHNGGFLGDTNPAGQGYSTFVEAFRDPHGIGVWREVAGSEENLDPVVPMTVDANIVYAVRLRVAQVDGQQTSLQSRMWIAGETEPDVWHVERTDASPGLQGARGGIAVDAWSNFVDGEAADMFFDDIVVTAAN